jgi:hypothetical protein
VSREGGRTANLRSLAKVATAALVGGLMAAVVLWWDGRLVAPTTFLVAFVVAVSYALVVDALRPQVPAPSRIPRTFSDNPAVGYSQPVVDAPQFLPPPAAPMPAKPVHTWFADAARDATAREAVASDAVGMSPQMPPEPEGNGVAPRIEEYRIPGSTSSVRCVAQCPRCAGFTLDVREQPRGFAFACRDCRHLWMWVPGTPWPITIARPSLGSAPHTGHV